MVKELQRSASCCSISMTEFSLPLKRVMEGDVPASLLEYTCYLPIRKTISMAVEGANLESPVRCKSVSAVLLDSGCFERLIERMYINHPQTTLLIIPYNMLSFNLVAFTVPINCS